MVVTGAHDQTMLLFLEDMVPFKTRLWQWRDMDTKNVLQILSSDELL